MKKLFVTKMIARIAAQPLAGPHSPHVPLERLHALWSCRSNRALRSRAQRNIRQLQRGIRRPSAALVDRGEVFLPEGADATAAEVNLAWKTPPPEYGPEPYFGMNGAVTIQSLAHDLDTMKSLGFHAVTAQAGGA